MHHPLVLQTLEFLKIINEMEYFTIEQRFSILSAIGEEVVDGNLSILSADVLSANTPEDWDQLPEAVRNLTQEICTHPKAPSALTQALYTHTNTPSKAPDILAIEQMQAEIEHQAKAEFEEWMLASLEEEQKEEYEENEEVSDTPEALPIPLDNENWDIGLILYHPTEKSFSIHFLQSGAKHTVPSEEPAVHEHPNPYLLSVSSQNIFSTPIPHDAFSSFSTPKFSNLDYLKKYNKKKKKILFLQLRQYHSNPVRTTFQCVGERFEIEVTHNNQNLGLTLKQLQSVSVRSQFGHKQTIDGLAPFIKKSGAQHVYTGKEQNTAGWSLDWVGPYSIPIYAKTSQMQYRHSSSGNHSNIISQTLSSYHGDHHSIPISHHKMPYTGMMQTHNDTEILSFEEMATEENHQRSPQLGKTGIINQEKSVQTYSCTPCASQVLISEQKTNLTTTQNNVPFRVKTSQECTNDTHIIIPCSQSKTLELYTDDSGILHVLLGSKTYKFHPIASQNTHMQKDTQSLQTTTHNGWNTSFLQESSSEELRITQKTTYEESGFIQTKE